MKTDDLLRWLANGERGVSSNTMATHLTGIGCMSPWGGSSYPHDPDDLARCRKLLDAVPDLKPLLSNMASCSAEWARLVPHWQALCDLMDAEAPRWADGVGAAPKTYARMCELLYGPRNAEQRP